VEGLHEVLEDDPTPFLPCGAATPTTADRGRVEEDARTQGTSHSVS